MQQFDDISTGCIEHDIACLQETKMPGSLNGRDLTLSRCSAHLVSWHDDRARALCGKNFGSGKFSLPRSILV